MRGLKQSPCNTPLSIRRNDAGYVSVTTVAAKSLYNDIIHSMMEHDGSLKPQVLNYGVLHQKHF